MKVELIPLHPSLHMDISEVPVGRVALGSSSGDIYLRLEKGALLFGNRGKSTRLIPEGDTREVILQPEGTVVQITT